MTVTREVSELRPSVATEFPTLVVATDETDASGSAYRTASLLAEINDVQVRGISAKSTPDELADFTRKNNARLVIVGMDSAETPARVAWLTHLPLLAVSPATQTIPHRIVIAMDLDPSQLGDIVPVLSLFGRASSMTCLHVQKPEDFPGSETPVFARAYSQAVREAFEEISGSAKKANGVQAELVRLKGDPAEEIIRFASSSDAELVVLGLRRHFGAHTLEGGHVAREVLRQAHCSVLIVPERRGAAG
jgi:nucleotide-binding universal stress UspA family protein